MVAGIGWVRFSAMVGFVFGALIQHMSTAGGSNVINVLGYFSLLGGTGRRPDGCHFFDGNGSNNNSCGSH